MNSHTPATTSLSVALVIGGTQGFGLAIAQSLSETHQVITVGRSGASSSFAIDHYACDIGNLPAWRHTLERIRGKGYRFSLIANVAGYARAMRPLEVTDAEWSRHFYLNTAYVAEGWAYLQPLLKPDSRILTIGSQWSYRNGCPYLLPYMTAKRGLLGLTEEFSLDPNVCISRCYCVPTMETPGYRDVRESFAKIGQEKIIDSFTTNALPAAPGPIARGIIQHLLEEGIPPSPHLWRVTITGECIPLQPTN